MSHALLVSLIACACATIPVAPPPAPTRCDGLATEVETLRCQRDLAVAELAKAKESAKRPTFVPHGFAPATAGLAPGYVPTQTRGIYVTTDIPSVGEGVAITHLQNGTYPFPDTSLIACAWDDSGHLQVQGNGSIGVYLDQSGGTKVGVPATIKVCARADAGLAFHNVPRDGRVRVLYAQVTTQTVGSYPVYRVVRDVTYVRGQRLGFTTYTGMDGY